MPAVFSKNPLVTVLSLMKNAIKEINIIIAEGGAPTGLIEVVGEINNNLNAKSLDLELLCEKVGKFKSIAQQHSDAKKENYLVRLHAVLNKGIGRLSELTATKADDIACLIDEEKSPSLSSSG